MFARRGAILIYTLGVMGLLIVLASVMLDVYMGMKHWSARSSQRLIARSAAAAGVDDATYHLVKSSAWDAGLDVTQPCGSRYQTSVVNNLVGPSPKLTPDGRTV